MFSEYIDGIAYDEFTRGDGTLNSLFDHEFGHSLYFSMMSKMSAKNRLAMIDDLVYSLIGKDGIKDYALTNEDELFAEGFKSWNLGETTEFAKSFGEFFKRWYK